MLYTKEGWIHHNITQPTWRTSGTQRPEQIIAATEAAVFKLEKLKESRTNISCALLLFLSRLLFQCSQGVFELYINPALLFFSSAVRLFFALVLECCCKFGWTIKGIRKLTPKRSTFVSFGSSEGGSKTMLFSQTSALVKATVTQLSNVPVGFFSLPSRWASAIAVWLLRVWCSRNVPDIDVKLPAKWFHIRASCVTKLGAVRYPALSEDTAALTASPLVWDSLKRILPGALLFKPHNTCDGMFGKSFYFILFFLPQLRQLLPPVTRNDVDVDGLAILK